MKKINGIRNIVLISFAVIFVAAAGIGEAWSYFTTYESAQGGYTINLGYETEIHEEVIGAQKEVTITNINKQDAPPSQPVFIRVKAFGSEKYQLKYEGTGWLKNSSECSYDNYNTGDNEWYYYNGIVNGGDSTSKLFIGFTFPKTEEVKDGDNFNIVVVYESTLVRYDDEGHPYADWSRKLDTGESSNEESEGGN